MSSFIKNSDAVLYPSSPSSSVSSPQKFLPTQEDSFVRTRAPSESDLPLKRDQIRLASVPSLATALLNGEESPTDSFSRIRSASLHFDQEHFLLSNAPSAISSRNSFEHDYKRTFPNVKTELVESPMTPSKDWVTYQTVPRPAPVSFANLHYSTNSITAKSEASSVYRNTGQLNSTFKQEKEFFPEQFNQTGLLQCSARLPASNSFRSTPFSPHHPINLSSVPKPTEITSNPNLMQHHFFHQHPANCSVAGSQGRLLQNGFTHHRSHPYLNLPQNYTSTVNGTIPYRPRFSRRNNPDLEKKRIHKCDHPGR